MAYQLLHLRPNAPFLHNKISHLDCSLAHSRPSSQKNYTKIFLHSHNVLINGRKLHNENSNHRMWRKKGAQFRPSSFGSESGQEIIDQCSENLEESDVETLELKENVFNGNGSVIVEEKQIEKHSVYAARDEEIEVKSADGFRFIEKCANMWQQMREVMLFAGPALGIWLCGPLMSLIDTAVVGQTSSLELAALGPATVVCDNLGYVFMFLSIATSNMIATSLAQQDEVALQKQLSRLMFVALACGIGMLLCTKAFGTPVLHAFVGTKNSNLVPAASTYVQIRGLAWPAVLVGMVAQSASLGMKDSWGPLKVLSVASLVNGVGDIILCSFCGYGIAGAAWATMVSQFVAALMMLGSVNTKGYNALALSVPSLEDLMQIAQLAAPVFITMITKTGFYALLTYFATSMGPETLAAHQVMIGVYCICTVWGEPLSQTAQSFMPALIHGVNRNLEKARSLLQSLVLCGAVIGITLGCIGIVVSLFFHGIFTRDTAVISQMHQIILPFFFSLIVTPPTLSLEGGLLAGRDLTYLSYVMSSNFCVCSFLLLIITTKGLGLQSCWWTLAFFQWTRFLVAYNRLTSASGPLYDHEILENKHHRLKIT